MAHKLSKYMSFKAGNHPDVSRRDSLGQPQGSSQLLGSCSQGLHHGGVGVQQLLGARQQVHGSPGPSRFASREASRNTSAANTPQGGRLGGLARGLEAKLAHWAAAQGQPAADGAGADGAAAAKMERGVEGQPEAPAVSPFAKPAQQEQALGGGRQVAMDLQAAAEAGAAGDDDGGLELPVVGQVRVVPSKRKQQQALGARGRGRGAKPRATRLGG